MNLRLSVCCSDVAEHEERNENDPGHTCHQADGLAGGAGPRPLQPGRQLLANNVEQVVGDEAHHGHEENLGEK